MEIIFEVSEDPVDGGYVAAAIGHGITTEADTIGDLRTMVKEAVQGSVGWGQVNCVGCRGNRHGRTRAVNWFAK